MRGLELRSILVATDLSERSDPQVRAAAAMAELTGGALHLLHAFEFALPEEEGASPSAATFAGRLEEAETRLEEQLRRAAPRAAVASRKVEVFVAFKAILNRAREVEADLIVLGPHRRRPVADKVLGATAEQVIQGAEVPCFLVHEGFEMPLRRILAPVDLMELSRPTLEAALRWASGLGIGNGGSGERTRVRVLHVARPDAATTAGQALDALVDAATTEVDRDRVEVVPEVVAGGAPTDAVIDTARERRSDLLVLATHGRGLVGRLLLGSVASGLVRRAPCPVLLIPPAVIDRRISG